MRVLAVGGEPAFVKDTMTPRLGEHGLVLVWHWDWGMKTAEKLPIGCEGVVIFREMVGHGLSNAAAALARTQEIPYVLISRKMAQALPVLRATGMVPPASVPVEKPDDNDLLEVLQQVLETEAASQHRFPSRDELLGRVKAAFGPNTTVSDALIRKARNCVIAKIGRFQVDPELLTEWAQLVVEEHIENEAEAAERLREIISEEGRITPSEEIAITAIEHAVKHLREAVWPSETGRTSLITAFNAWRARHTKLSDAEVRAKAPLLFGNVWNPPWDPVPAPVVVVEPVVPVAVAVPEEPVVPVAVDDGRIAELEARLRSSNAKLGAAGLNIKRVTAERDRLLSERNALQQELCRQDAVRLGHEKTILELQMTLAALQDAAAKNTLTPASMDIGILDLAKQGYDITLTRVH